MFTAVCVCLRLIHQKFYRKSRCAAASHLLIFSTSQPLTFLPSNLFPDLIKAVQRLVGERVLEHFEKQRVRH